MCLELLEGLEGVEVGIGVVQPDNEPNGYQVILYNEPYSYQVILNNEPYSYQVILDNEPYSY